MPFVTDTSYPLAGVIGSGDAVVGTHSSAVRRFAMATVADQSSLAGAVDDYGVVTGCAVTATTSNMVVSVAAGVTQHGTPGTTATVIAQTATATTADATNPRFDRVVVSSAGVMSIVAGTAAPVPAFPAVPAGSVELAILYIPATVTALTTAANVIDRRTTISTGAWINVKDYGARGDTRKYTDGAITTGTATFTSATATFVAGDKGKTITIGGAGAAGVPFTTTILSVTNSTTVTLAANASTTVSGKSFGFGTDDTAAITAAIAAAAALPLGGTVYFPPGIYGAASSITGTTKYNFVLKGAGQETTMLYQLGYGYRLVNFPNPFAGIVANSYIGVEDLSAWGRFDKLNTEDLGDNKQFWMEADRVWYRRVQSFYSEQMALTGTGKTEAKVEFCSVEKAGRDAINLTGSGRFNAVGNTIQECTDDAIAYHTLVGLTPGTINSQPCAIVGNVISKSSGIKLLGATNAVISGNSVRFGSGYGIYIDYDNVSGEGNKDPLGISITGNSIVDTINLVYMGQASLGTAIWIATPPPQSGVDLGRTVANASMTAASPNLTSATIAWTAADIGRTVTVTGAGTAGATLSSRVKSITSGTIAVLDDNAVTTVSNATLKLSLLPYIPAMTSYGTGTVAVKGPASNSWNGVSNAATGAYGVLVANNTIINTLDGTKADGTAATTFGDYGFGTLWWYGGSFNPSFVSNVPTSGATIASNEGITLRDGAVRDVLVTGNMIYGVSAGVYIGGLKVFPEARITNNKITRARKAIEIAYNVVTNMNIWIEENEINCDPLFESSERTVATSQPTGTWTRAAGNTAVAVYSYQCYGVYLVRNRIRNACNLSTGGGTEAVACYDNILIMDSTVGTPAGSPSFGGVGASAAELAQSKIIQEISDPRLTTYGQLSSVFAQTATAMPTSGTWTQNTVVNNSTPTIYSGASVMGWLRITNGTSNVAGTDWETLYTGEPSANAVTTPAAGFAADTLLTGSVVVIPAGLPAVGTTYKLRFYVAKTAAGTATPIINIRIGTAGTAADTARLTFTFGAGTAVADEGLFEVMATFRTVGATTTAVISGYAVLTNNLQTTGLSSTIKAKSVTSAGFDSTVANLKISASYNGGTSAAHTVSFVRAELTPS